MTQQYYVEVTDERVDLDPPYVWQSEVYDDRTTALKAARRIAAGFGRSDIKPLTTTGDYLNPNWEISAKGVKSALHVDLMKMEWYNKDSYDIKIEESVK